MENNILSPINKSVSFENRTFVSDNRIKYASNFMKHFTSTSIGDFIILKQDKYSYKNLILNKKIGSKSKYGAVYSVTYGIKPRIYTAASKLICINESNTKELSILEKITKIILAKKTIHFPIMYFYTTISKTSNMKSSLLPEAIRYCDNFYVSFNEMFSGDLKMLMSSKKQTTAFMKNAITQIFFSISNFSHYTGFIHKDAHWGNFLYHKIKPGGYFYYKVNGIDVYLENIGFIWVIWDYGFAIKITSDNVIKDYSRIIHAFYPKLYGGWIPNNITYNTKDIDFPLNITRSLRVLSYNRDSYKTKKKQVHNILFDLYPELLIKPDESLIINKKPFVIT
jgi:hypothetical protein